MESTTRRNEVVLLAASSVHFYRRLKNIANHQKHIGKWMEKQWICRFFLLHFENLFLEFNFVILWMRTIDNSRTTRRKCTSTLLTRSFNRLRYRPTVSRSITIIPTVILSMNINLPYTSQWILTYRTSYQYKFLPSARLPSSSARFCRGDYRSASDARIGLDYGSESASDRLGFRWWWRWLGRERDQSTGGDGGAE